MAEAKHTPGPWQVRKSFVGTEFMYIFSEHVDRLATCRNLADARLIAAAPDLYAALKAAVDFARTSGIACGYNTNLFDAMVAAIGKAEAEG